MGCGLSKIRDIAREAEFTINISCCNEHEYKSLRLSKKQLQGLHLSPDESYFVYGKRFYKFSTPDSLHKFIHDIEGRTKPLNCNAGEYIHNL